MYTRNVILCMVCLIAVEYWSSLVLFCVDVFYTVYRGHSMMLIALQSHVRFTCILAFLQTYSIAGFSARFILI